MSNIAQVQLSDTFDYQRKRINDAIDIVNSMGGGITEVASETSLPDPASATSNVYLIRNHTKFKGAALAALINGIYKITPLKNDVMNSNQFIYIDAAQLSSSASINKCVYLDSTGVWQLANSSDPNKYAQGIVGPYNSIILGGILYSAGLNLIKGATYYYNSTGSLTTEETIGKVGVALDSHTLSLHFLSINTNIQDKSTAVNYNHITNCVTEIPQDIQLELNNGTLTLKAGSKVYVPNGAGVFNQLPITIDKTATQTTNDTRLYFYNGTYIEKFPIAQCFSGSSAPSGYTYMFWYDTTNNVVKKTSNSGSTWESGWSLPFAICTSTNSAISSIDQVFNGFGYMGSTAFALPGVKALAPNGRNEDGTLKNRTITISSVSTTTDVSGATGSLWYTIDNNNITRVNLDTFTFNEELNYFVNSSGQKFGFVIVDENSYRTNGQITSFNPHEVFRAVDYNNLKLVSKSNDGLVPKLPNETTVKKFLRQDCTWAEPDIKLVSKSNNGLVPKLPNETTVKKFFRQDGAWVEPDYISINGGATNGYIGDALSTGQVRNISAGTSLPDPNDLNVGDIFLLI